MSGIYYKQIATKNKYPEVYSCEFTWKATIIDDLCCASFSFKRNPSYIAKLSRSVKRASTWALCGICTYICFWRACLESDTLLEFFLPWLHWHHMRWEAVYSNTSFPVLVTPRLQRTKTSNHCHFAVSSLISKLSKPMGIWFPRECWTVRWRG